MSRAVAFSSSESLRPGPAGYVHDATLPLASLVLLSPLITLYEVGTRFMTTAAQQGKDQQIIAFSKMLQFFHMCGATGRYMPALAVAGGLIGSHLMRRDRWVIEFRTIAGMATEGILLGLPLLLFAFLVNRYFPLIGMLSESGAGPAGSSLQDRLIMDLGAGVYEEFVFRLLLCSVISLLLKDFLMVDKKAVHPLMVVLSGLLFSLYHYWSPSEHFIFRIFAFRTVAGIYFALIFMFRGFGITSVSHCAYDIIITLW